MLTMANTEEPNMEKKEISQEERLTPAEAVEYLRTKRGIIMSTSALKLRRNRGTATAAKKLPRMSFWTKSELDALPIAPQTRLVEGFGQSGDNSEEQ